MARADQSPSRRCLLACHDAVSPVISVIFTVAIATILAATVLVAVSEIGPSGGSGLPNVSVQVSEAEDRATITGASQGASWNQLQIRISIDGGWGLNQPATTGTTAGEWNLVNAGSVVAGDYLDICADVEGPVEVMIRYLDLNTVISSFSLNLVQGC